jgi:hypothetical protein
VGGVDSFGAEAALNDLPYCSPDFGRGDDVDAREFSEAADFAGGIAEDAFSADDRVFAC